MLPPLPALPQGRNALRACLVTCVIAGAPSLGWAQAISPIPSPSPGSTLLSATPVSNARGAATDPAYSVQTYDRTRAALATYRTLAEQGGWLNSPGVLRALVPGAVDPLIPGLRRRLAIESDIDPQDVSSDLFDATLVDALKRFQARHGLSETGTVGTLTLRALNISASTKVRQLEANLVRLRDTGFVFANRYVVVNIPGASVEAIDGGLVARRHLAVVGRKDRASPVVQTRITAVNLNPTWTVPLSIVKADIMPKVREDLGFLAKSNMRVLDASGTELDPATIDWNGPVNFTIRQDSGPTNALGQLRLDMPNAHAVYMHDTPKKGLFRSDIRFQSSGCARIADIAGLAVWLMEDGGVTRDALDQALATGERQTVRLHKAVPVAWIYMTAWGEASGQAQFRDDIYGLDQPTTASTPADVTGSIRPPTSKASTRVSGSSSATVRQPAAAAARSKPGSRVLGNDALAGDLVVNAPPVNAPVAKKPPVVTTPPKTSPVSTRPNTVAVPPEPRQTLPADRVQDVARPTIKADAERRGLVERLFAGWADAR